MAVQVPSRLYRSRSQKMIAGVSGGLGEYFDVDPVLIRLLFVITTFVSGVGLLAYVVLWIVVPLQGDDETPRLDALRRDFDDISTRVRDQLDPRRPAAPGEPTVAGAPTTGAAPTTAPSGTEAGGVTGGVAGATTAGFAATDPTVTATSAASGSPGAAGAAPSDDPLTVPLDPPRYDPSLADAPTRPAEAVGGREYGTGAYAAGGDVAGSYGPRGYEPPAYDGASGPSATAPFGVTEAPVDRTRRRQHWAGAILIVLGVLFLAQNLGLLWWVHARFIWPLALVGIGAWLLFGRGRRG